MSDTKNTNVNKIENNNVTGSPQKSLEFHPPKKTELPNTRTSPHGNHEAKYDMKHDKEVSLQKELETVRSMNEVVEKVLSSLESAQGNIATVMQTVNSASTLLDAWVKILSYTEHNQRLITNPNWKGASADITNIENESILKAQAEEKRVLEEEKRKEEAKTLEEEEERRRQVGNPSRGPRGALGRFGRSKRGYLSSSLNTIGRVSGAHSSGRGIPVARAGSGIGRGLGTSRGRSRGTR